ncbi:hypothetical protein [Calidifontibacillus erzurumensis]|uniref:Uncharacterized protein n=1 Tax=Calidifontibacillus erzurumensis TaxID=2741433 RepID=A0A8J8K722_9BACI|nr:hypothetical protein [Calidifontibacillus erzurumensis]NSL50301.1 hypothetical protein [Calidifontibacillus erzurumensis]
MDKNRKEIILKEIHFWKEHHLLPEHYCNFLITLYTEGSESERKIYEKKQVGLHKKLFSYFFYAYLLLQFLLTVVVLYFTEMSIDLQIASVSFFLIVNALSIVYLWKKKRQFFHIALIIGVLILFLTTVHVSSLLTDESIYFFFTVLLNCAFWVFIGFRLHLKYLIISGILGASLLIIYSYL